MPGLFSQAIIDPSTNELVTNGSVSVYTYLDSSALATVYSDFNCTIELNQPLTTDSEGVLTFFSTGPGQMFYLSRGGTPRLVTASGVDDGSSSGEVSTQFLTNLTSGEFFLENGPIYMSQLFASGVSTISGDTTFDNDGISGTDNGSWVVDSADDVTITLSPTCVSNAQMVFVQVNDGAAIFEVPAGSTLINLYSHNRTAGPGSVAMIICVAGGNPGDPNSTYVLCGQTAAA